MLSKLNLNILGNAPMALAVSGGPDSMAMLHMMHGKEIRFVAIAQHNNRVTLANAGTPVYIGHGPPNIAEALCGMTINITDRI